MDESPQAVAENDILTLNALQRYMNGGSDTPTAHDHGELNADAVAYNRIFETVAVCTGTAAKGRYTYTLQNQPHSIISSRLVFTTPKITVKPEHRETVRIAFCHNLGHNIVAGAVLKSNGRVVGAPLTSQILDIRLQFFTARERRQEYREAIGAVPDLEDFSDHIDPYFITAPQPFSYSRDIHKSLKVVVAGGVMADTDGTLKPVAATITHEYKLRTKLTELLRGQVYDAATQKWCDITPERLLDYCVVDSGVTSEMHLNPPDLWVRCTMMAAAEVGYWTGQAKSTYECFVNEVVPVESSGSNGVDVFFNVVGDYTPRIMFWVSENVDATRFNNFSRYCTDTNTDPVESSTYRREKSDEWKDLPSGFNNRGLINVQGIHLPDEPGYHAHVWCYDVRRTGIDTNVNMVTKESRLTLRYFPNCGPSKYTAYCFVETARVLRYAADGLRILDSGAFDTVPPVGRPAYVADV